MRISSNQVLRIAILDLYEGVANEGMRCIRKLIAETADRYQVKLVCDEFDVRRSIHLPGLDYDIYISSGGPGSPLESEGTEWENSYFKWIEAVEQYNDAPSHEIKKRVLFICHSYQLACRFFGIGQVAERKSPAFGVFPVHMMEDGLNEPVFNGLHDPFYAVDSRNFQVIAPDFEKMEQIGASVLAIEKERPHVPLERAIMAVRFNEYMVGTQFHPEADAIGMSMYLQREDKKEMVIENHGHEKWRSMIDQLNDPDKILWTYSHVIPNFLADAIKAATSK